MAVAGLVAIMDEVANRIRSVMEETTDVDVQVEGRLIRTPTTPTIDVIPGDLPRFADSAGFGLLDDQGGYVLTVRVRCSTSDDFAQQDLMLAFMDDTDPLCVAAAVQEDETLNGLASSLSVQDPTGMFPDPWEPFGTMMAFQFTVVVLPAES